MAGEQTDEAKGASVALEPTPDIKVPNSEQKAPAAGGGAENPVVAADQGKPIEKGLYP